MDGHGGGDYVPSLIKFRYLGIQRSACLCLLMLESHTAFLKLPCLTTVRKQPSCLFVYLHPLPVCMCTRVCVCFCVHDVHPVTGLAGL